MRIFSSDSLRNIDSAGLNEEARAAVQSPCFSPEAISGNKQTA
jgi:hypothetical protein